MAKLIIACWKSELITLLVDKHFLIFLKINDFAESAVLNTWEQYQSEGSQCFNASLNVSNVSDKLLLHFPR